MNYNDRDECRRIIAALSDAFDYRDAEDNYREYVDLREAAKNARKLVRRIEEAMDES